MTEFRVHQQTQQDILTQSAAIPKFKVGDTVIVKGGRAHRWRISAIQHQPHEIEPGYYLDNGDRIRTATESVLTLIPPETPADREAWLDRHRG